jgi:hypothetical protein
MEINLEILMDLLKLMEKLMAILKDLMTEK